MVVLIYIYLRLNTSSYVYWPNVFFSNFLVLFKNIFYWLCYYSYPIFPPLLPSTQYPHTLQQSPLSSCPWVVYVSSLATPFPILFLTSPSLFCTYQLVLLNPCNFPPYSHFPLPADNHPNDLNIYDSISVLLACLVCFLDSVVDSCKFIAIYCS